MSLVSYSLWGRKESDTTDYIHTDIMHTHTALFAERALKDMINVT